MSRKIIFILLSLLVTASMLLAACQPAPTEAPAETAPTEAAPAAQPTAVPPTEAAAGEEPAAVSRIVYADNDSYYTLDPFVSASQWLQHAAIFDQLWVLNLDMTSYSGVLAESWEASADGLTITINLREDATFSDGAPVDAETIKWDIDYYRDPELASAFGGWMMDVVDSVEVVDTYTLKVILKTPYAPFYYWMAQMCFPSAAAFQEFGPEAFAMAPIGSGPFVVKEVIPDVSILFEKNPNYHQYPDFLQNRGASMVDELLIKYGLSEEVAYAQLETGEVDIAQIPSPMVDQALANPNLEITEVVQAGIRYLGFNTEIAPYNDQAFRVALAYAINRDELVQVGYEGRAIPLWTTLSPSVFGYNDEFEQQVKAAEAYDPDKTIQMLADAGYVDADGDGFIDNKDGTPMVLTLAYTEGVTAKLVSETLQGQFADIGLNVELEALEGQVIMDMTREGTHSMIFWSYGLSDATILTYMFKSNRIGGSNRTRFNDPQMDTLLDIMESEMNPEVRKEKIIDALQYLVEMHPSIPLLAEYRYFAYRSDKFTGVQFDVSGFPVLGDAQPVQ